MAEPLCPKCGAEMVLRQAKRGPNKGKNFYGCSNYFVTKCNGTIELDEINKNYDKSDNIEIAKPYYSGFEVSFYQSIAIPYEILEMINQDIISTKEMRRYSQWRLERHINDKTPLKNDIHNILTLMKKILNRGTLTIISDQIEESLKKLYNIKDLENEKIFNTDCYLVHKKIENLKKIDFGNSKYEGKFYYEALPKFFGEFYQYFVIPQISLETLIESEKITEEFEHRRPDFLITTNNHSYVIELNGDEHLEHKGKDQERKKILEQAGYKFIEIWNDDNYINKLNENFIDIDNEIKYIKRELTGFEKYMVTTKTIHQVLVALTDALLHGYNFYENQEININLSTDTIDKSIEKEVCLLIQNEFNELLGQIVRLFKIEKEMLSLKFKPYVKEAKGLIISFNESCINTPNNMMINDIFIDKIVANSCLSSSLKYYDLPKEDNLEYFLKYLFRKDKFREGQFEAISRGLEGKDTLVLLPTGAGKSIAFQLTSMLLNGVTIVIDPIIALINDQIENLNRIGIDRIAGITSLISDHKTRTKTYQAFSMGDYLITYVAPERLQSLEFRKAINGLITITPIPLVAIDEAHCVSEWGHDFRTSYLNIGRISRAYCGFGKKQPCIIGLTGTASNTVLRDVQRELDIKDYDAIITPKTFDRQELTYDVFESISSEKENILENLLNRYFPEKLNINHSTFNSLNGDKTRCGLVFCPHVNGSFGVQNVKNSIEKKLRLSAEMYSGEKPKYSNCLNWNNEKNKVARDFKNNKFNLLIATKAFGMGIDKPNINYTVHYGLPNSIESFYQEAGRAGRNGELAKCVLLVSNDNPLRSKQLLDPKNSIDELNKIMKSEVNFENADDITRTLFFHLNSFKGIENEMESVMYILDQIGDLNTSRKVILIANKDFNRGLIEKALYRLIVLGVITDYTIDYSNEEFTADYIKIDKDLMIDKYAVYVSGYNKTRVNKETEKLQLGYDLQFKDFIINSCWVLISFIYDTIEKGRRRGISEILSLAEEALGADNSDKRDEIIRKRILRYLETTYSEEIEKILTVDVLKLDIIKDLIDGYETKDGKIIGGLRSSKDAEEIRGQVSRFLESTPDHPALLILRALSELFSSNYDKLQVISNFEAAIKYAKDQLGYSIDSDEFYKIIAWSVVKIGERDIKIYNELISDLLESFNNLDLAKHTLRFSLNNSKFMYLPAQYILNENHNRINQIIWRKNNVGK